MSEESKYPNNLRLMSAEVAPPANREEGICDVTAGAALSSRLSMDEVAELCALHAGAGGIAKPDYQHVVAGIRNTGATAGNWTRCWREEGQRLKRVGRPAEAMQAFNLARFPFADTDDRRRALKECAECFGHSTGTRRHEILRIEVAHQGESASAYLVRAKRRPAAGTIIVCGGIVSIKEQWTNFVLAANRLGVDAILTEMPQVGHNTVPYTPDSGSVFSALLDHEAAGGPERVHAVALSFSANLVLRQALKDKRIASVSTVGAPVNFFFHKEDWWRQVPETTRLTLQHMLGAPDAGTTFEALHPFALGEDELASLSIPLAYVRPTQDEIIEAEEVEFLRRCYGGSLLVLEVADIHGAPRHLGLVRLFLARAVLAAAAPGSLKARAAGAMLKLKARFAKASLS